MKSRKPSRDEHGPCERCGATQFIDGHHDDYSKPNEVRYLCRRCHRQFHVTLRASRPLPPEIHQEIVEAVDIAMEVARVRRSP